jgi:hypothetical protein
MEIYSIILIALGLIVLGFGSRLALLGAGIGALLGIGLLRILPGDQSSVWWWIVPIGLAILFAIGSGLAKGLIGLVTLALGALAGGAIVLAILDLFALDWGLMNWVLALVGAVIGAALMSRFKDWGLIILAALVGGLLFMRGLQMLIPSLDGLIASLIGLVVVGGSIAYQGGLIGRRLEAIIKDAVLRLLLFTPASHSVAFQSAIMVESRLRSGLKVKGRLLSQWLDAR